MINTYSTITRNINNSHTQKNAGYIVYWKLTFKLWKMFFQSARKISFIQFVYRLFVMLFKTPFWLLIKPAFQVFSVKTKMQGSCTWQNDKLIKNSIKKSKYIRIIGIPFLWYPSAITNEEWQKIKK